MKITLICPSNMLYMPYVGNYEKILKENTVDYDVINWDRFDIEDKNNPFRYRDRKIGHQRGFIDYYKFKQFIIKRLNSTKHDKLIVFGIQLSFFLEGILRKKYKGNYIIDIRDHNKIANYFNIEKVISHSAFTVISSLGYKDWLPKDKNYIVNHNTQISSLLELINPSVTTINDKISIAYIGAIRDYQVNVDFISALKNNQRIDLNFHGEGDINKNIQDYLNSNSIKNVRLTGRYEKNEENTLYSINDLINVLRYDDGINNKTASPNRLYNAVLHGKPVIAFDGTYLASQVKKYKLGMVLDSFDDVACKIENYMEKIDLADYERGRVAFFEEVIKENDIFKESLEKFIRHEK